MEAVMTQDEFEAGVTSTMTSSAARARMTTRTERVMEEQIDIIRKHSPGFPASLLTDCGSDAPAEF
jgi:L-aminopeptidase/D-esterase-like protein